ncbi:SGNH/GDSL hydrolase family protein [Paractinoplanes atraurantiacus]|uniref:Lysophospholipase L1 n=1 Tax=Paractinoplanes atraurantiacus TaxID=1036182 RepID=A0A285JLT8_9ACTN|nr:SGNH/GDSL hydrolase family protein [Actinoplanes atraurantiacus]SNY61033.1 Lysophospholipase L1 [Actinoplanes atraurantiacus]
MRRAAVLLLLLLAACDPSAAPVVVTLGDSVAAGASCACQPFPALYASSQHATNVNLARSGATAADVRAAVPAEKAVFASATEVVIMIGANDMAGDFDDPSKYPAVATGVQDDVESTIKAIEAVHRTRVVVLGYWNVVLDGKVAAKTYGADKVSDSESATAVVNKALQTAATQTGSTYIPTDAAFHGPDGSNDPTTLLAPDGDHPNAAGQRAIAALIPPLP